MAIDPTKVAAAANMIKSYHTAKVEALVAMLDKFDADLEAAMADFPEELKTDTVYQTHQAVKMAASPWQLQNLKSTYGLTPAPTPMTPPAPAPTPIA